MNISSARHTMLPRDGVSLKTLREGYLMGGLAFGLAQIPKQTT